MNYFQTVIASLAFCCMCSSSFSQTADLDIWLSAGEYLGAHDLLERLGESPCGYVLSKQYSLNEAADVVLDHLESSLNLDLVSFLNGTVGRAEF